MPPNKLKSKIWNYFKRTGGIEAICKICNKSLKTSGNTTNLRGHLENVHSQQLEVFDVPCKKKKPNSITDFMSVNDATHAPALASIASTNQDNELPTTSNSDVNFNASTSSSAVKDVSSLSSQNSVASTSSNVVIHL